MYQFMASHNTHHHQKSNLFSISPHSRIYVSSYCTVTFRGRYGSEKPYPLGKDLIGGLRRSSMISRNVRGMTNIYYTGNYFNAGSGFRLYIYRCWERKLLFVNVLELASVILSDQELNRLHLSEPMPQFQPWKYFHNFTIFYTS
jgi:hypothetical protein